MHYVLVDHENVQPTDIGLLDRPDVRVFVFVGAKQGKLSSDMAIDMQNRLGERAKYVRISAVGKNALDFHIAYTIGRLAVQHPDAHFHVVAADKGYDPLLVHLKGNGIAGSRAERIAALPLFKSQAAVAKPSAGPAPAKPKPEEPPAVRIIVEPELPKKAQVAAPAKPAVVPPSPLPLAQAKTTAQRWTKLRSGLKKMDGNRPLTLAALKKHVGAQFAGDKVGQDTVDALIAGLVKFGLLVVTANNKLTWNAEKF
jgi:hypothetical protein